MEGMRSVGSVAPRIRCVEQLLWRLGSLFLIGIMHVPVTQAQESSSNFKSTKLSALISIALDSASSIKVPGCIERVGQELTVKGLIDLYLKHPDHLYRNCLSGFDVITEKGKALVLLDHIATHQDLRLFQINGVSADETGTIENSVAPHFYILDIATESVFMVMWNTILDTEPNEKGNSMMREHADLDEFYVYRLGPLLHPVSRLLVEHDRVALVSSYIERDAEPCSIQESLYLPICDAPKIRIECDRSELSIQDLDLWLGDLLLNRVLVGKYERSLDRLSDAYIYPFYFIGAR